MDVLDLLDKKVLHSINTDDPFFTIDHERIVVLIEVARAAKQLVDKCHSDLIPANRLLLTDLREALTKLGVVRDE